MNLFKFSNRNFKFVSLEGDEEDQQQVSASPVLTAVAGSGKKKKLINQFNFCERAALTFTNPARVRSISYILFSRHHFNEFFKM